MTNAKIKSVMALVLPIAALIVGSCLVLWQWGMFQHLISNDGGRFHYFLLNPIPSSFVVMFGVVTALVGLLSLAMEIRCRNFKKHIA